MKVLLSFEYGYMDYVWDYPGTLHELFTDYAAGAIPYFGGPQQQSRGYAVERDGEPQRDFNVVIHVHEADDSDIRYGKWLPPSEDWPRGVFEPIIRVEGYPGEARYDAVTALVVATLEVVPPG